MSFPAKHLNEGEEIVIDTHPHWWYLAGPTAAVVVVLSGALTVVVVGSPAWAGCEAAGAGFSVLLEHDTAANTTTNAHARIFTDFMDAFLNRLKC